MSRFPLLLALTLALPACEAEPPPVAAAPPLPISGLYEVEGYTTNRDTGADERRVEGSIVIRQEGQAYTATFDLKTSAPGLGGSHSVSLIGTGEGAVEGRRLTGSASTQLVTSVVPGVDAGFAFVPRQTSTRILSRSEAEIGADGKVKVKIETDGAPGEDYTPTRTRLRGRRVGDPREPWRPRPQRRGEEAG